LGTLTELADQIEGRTPGQQIMVEEGLPEAAIVAPEERRDAWKGRKLTKPRDIKAPAKDEEPATKALRKELAKAKETKKAARLARLNELKGTAMPKTKLAPKANKKAAKAPVAKKATKARAKATAAPRPAAGSAKGLRPGSKVALVANLLTRPQGCTATEVKAACDWTAVSMPAQAKAAGLTLRQEKIDGVTRYYGSAA
jgi:Protein of unknown function (DUF3489)